MALSFPSSPTVNQTTTTGGQTWTWNGTSWLSGGTGGGSSAAATTVSTTAPTSPVEGQMWYDTTDGTLLIRTGSIWVESVVALAGPPGTNGAAGAAGAAGTSANPLPVGNIAQRPVSPVAGTMRINSETN